MSLTYSIAASIDFLLSREHVERGGITTVSDHEKGPPENRRALRGGDHQGACSSAWKNWRGMVEESAGMLIPVAVALVKVTPVGEKPLRVVELVMS